MTDGCEGRTQASLCETERKREANCLGCVARGGQEEAGLEIAASIIRLWRYARRPNGVFRYCNNSETIRRMVEQSRCDGPQSNRPNRHQRAVRLQIQIRRSQSGSNKRRCKPWQFPSRPFRAIYHKAIQEQFGLKLEPGRARFEIIMIDGVERPSQN